MIKKSIVFTVILLAVYGALIGLLGDSVAPSGESYDETNKRIAKDFLENAATYKNVIFGSSMGTRLTMEEFGSDTYNLSFVGRSALDGLFLTRHRGQAPDLVLVESNVLDRPQNLPFTRSITSPFAGSLSIKKHLRPIELTVNLLNKKKGKTSGSVNQEVPRQQIVQEALNKNIETWQKFRPVFKNLDQIEDYFKWLTANGSQVVIFEMPMHPEISKSPKAEFLRSAIHERFPDIPFIPSPSSTNYSTRDGIHLTPESALNYSTHLANEIKRLQRPD